MTTPNWQHHSRKEQKRKLKPQALRDARRRRQALKNKLSPRGDKPGGFSLQVSIPHRAWG